MSQYLPTGNFKWMGNKEIEKIDLGKYKEDSKKGLILQVDLEYPQELHDLHKVVMYYTPGHFCKKCHWMCSTSLLLPVGSIC